MAYTCGGGYVFLTRSGERALVDTVTKMWDSTSNNEIAARSIAKGLEQTPG